MNWHSVGQRQRVTCKLASVPEQMERLLAFVAGGGGGADTQREL
jgi:hypothetical protein